LKDFPFPTFPFRAPLPETLPLLCARRVFRRWADGSDAGRGKRHATWGVGFGVMTQTGLVSVLPPLVRFSILSFFKQNDWLGQ
jgi:hypothetical protein